MPRWKPWHLPFHAAPTGQLSERVYALRTSHANAYLYRGDQATVAFDAGVSAPALQAALVELGVDPREVKAVFLTHGDQDHTGGLDLFPDAQVYLSADEEQMVTGATERMFGMRYNPPMARERTPLQDGQAVQIGDVHVQAIATPGHTPGSTCYLVDGRALFTGDTLSLRGGWVAPFVRLINMDHATQLASLYKLAALDGVEWVCTGHSGYSGEWDRAVADWRTLGAR